MRNDTIRIGVVGAGLNTKSRHIPGLQAIDGVEVVSVANRSRESSQRVADEFHIPKVYDSWADLIAAPDTNAICIGTWPYMHRTLVLAALEHGKHVMTEARMAMDARQAHEMLAASLQKPDLVAHVVPAPFIDKVEATIKELVLNGYLGDLLSVDIAGGSPGAPNGAFIDHRGPMHWRYDRDLSGYNVMLLGAWYECLMRLIGPASSVNAITRVYGNSHIDASGNLHVATIPDHVEVLYETPSGPVVHIRLSQVTGLAPPDRLWLFGTEGTLYVDAGKEELSGGRRGDEVLQAIDIPAEKQGHWRVEEEFVNAIRGIEPITHTTFEDGVRYMDFTEAVARSARARKTVYLPL
jgi:predicted dehydrogenase